MKTRSIATLMLFGCLLLGTISAEGDEISRNNIRFKVWGVDSLGLHGSYYPTHDVDFGVALILPDRSREGGNYISIASRLQRAGVPVFLPDLRGQGDSDFSGRGPVPQISEWNRGARGLIARDLNGVLELAAHQDYLKGEEWLLIAAGESAAIGVEMATSDPRFRRLVLVSPIFQSDFDRDLLLNLPDLYVTACRGDSVSMESVWEMESILDDDSYRQDIIQGRSRGDRLLHWAPEVMRRILQWIRDDR
jgi:pimeloyl-ACP methyl ester carboxylesterase